MANIQFNRKEFEKHLKLDEKTIERISLFGTPAKISEDHLEIELFPNRPDLIPMYGFIRALKAFLGKEPGMKSYKVIKPDRNYKIKISPSVKSIRPFTACAIVKGLKFDNERIKEIIAIQEKIHATLGRNRKKLALGVYPLDKINLPISYEARDPDKIKFHPLGSEKEMSGKEILEDHPTGREFAHLLKGHEKFPVFVDAKGKILSMPPIINSAETGRITEQTQDVFIECSGFNQHLLNKTLIIIITALSDMGGKIHAMELDYGKKEITPDMTVEKMKISLDDVNKTLGLSLKEKDLEKLLPRMEYDYKQESLKIPPWRIDIMHPVDIIEDIAIAYGYANLVPVVPQIATLGEESHESQAKATLSEILTGLNLLEITSFHLIKHDEMKRMKVECLELEDSKTEYKYLRPNLLIPALRVFAENKDHEYPQRIFELGTVFSVDKKRLTESGIQENDNLLVAIAPGNFTEIKQILDYLARTYNVHYTLEESFVPGLLEGRSGTLYHDKKIIGYLGEVHPETLQAWNIKMPLAVLELSREFLQPK
ncbi:phenylalanine--tRNA ligase subunit beta [Candidatus Pacearchaeota archaeon]|nr:phenylalanine--tRNA ligase subunit beta [Candidatus Pacearchaeota archaeon]